MCPKVPICRATSSNRPTYHLVMADCRGVMTWTVGGSPTAIVRSVSGLGARANLRVRPHSAAISSVHGARPRLIRPDISTIYYYDRCRSAHFGTFIYLSHLDLMLGARSGCAGVFMSCAYVLPFVWSGASTPLKHGRSLRP